MSEDRSRVGPASVVCPAPGTRPRRGAVEVAADWTSPPGWRPSPACWDDGPFSGGAPGTSSGRRCCRPLSRCSCTAPAVCWGWTAANTGPSPAGCSASGPRCASLPASDDRSAACTPTGSVCPDCCCPVSGTPASCAGSSGRFRSPAAMSSTGVMTRPASGSGCAGASPTAGGVRRARAEVVPGVLPLLGRHGPDDLLGMRGRHGGLGRLRTAHEQEREPQQPAEEEHHEQRTPCRSSARGAHGGRGERDSQDGEPFPTKR